MDQDAPGKAALLISPDLLFAGKIQAAAEPLGVRVLQETDLPAITRTLEKPGVCVVFLDLNVNSPAISEVLELLPADTRPLVVAFGPHVNTLRLEEARNLGCDRVLPRSRFVQELPSLIKLAIENS
jgi:hypothetical protein